LNEAANIDVNWSVRSATGVQLKLGRSSLHMPVHGSGFDDLVLAHTQALAAISNEIAAQIKTIATVSKQ
jgi:uncharacterized lipoprotein YmbA